MADVDLQIECEDPHLPDLDTLDHWVNTALIAAEVPYRADAEVSIVFIDSDHMQRLNAQYRNKDRPTNVLSFPCELPEEVGVRLLGDIAICVPIVAEEAEQFEKPFSAHCAHLVVHGVLHLLGYNHIEDDEAETMETLENKVLTILGYPPPYL